MPGLGWYELIPLRRSFSMRTVLLAGLAAFLAGLAAAAKALDPQPGDLFSLDDRGVLWLVDGQTGGRTPVSSPGETVLCTGTGTPYECCSGSNTGTGLGPCAVIGTGPSWHLTSNGL